MQDVAQRTHNIWRRLKAQFRWTFVEDEAAFVAEIVRELSTRPHPSGLSDSEISASIQQLYNRRMYAAFVAGLQELEDEAAVAATQRAGEEIRLMALRQVRAKGYPEEFAQDLAQQVLVRLIEKPYAIREPGCLPVYIRYQILDLLKAINRRASELSLDAEDGSDHPVAGSHNPTEQIDDALFVEQVLNELPTLLSLFQQRVIQLVIWEDHSAIDAATILGVKPHQVRAEKARALAKIRRHLGYESE